MDISLKEVDFRNPDLLHLITKLDQYLYEIYPADEVFGVDFSDPRIAEIIFVIAYDSDVPVGCGAIRRVDHDVVELKRFFVEVDYRKRGIAGKILRYLEERAINLNYGVIRLETGAPQSESIYFYKKHGYTEIERYGEYVACESSLCYEKQLSSSEDL
ncbi:GNAT family N-acetyltransferase [Paenibacillus segetis]|uniref:N-acetyltransferase n=1 Tax=Paenibacillus segetis TaxID=1325360 RepID=A0ABQ1Y540_9BACL|nr:GNAT family N-acetyltransferase [Paenibacillus segetis]GGH13054.1 N-acetyltransferase [Paenibacillus segetis]